jgi:ribonuclease P protein component
MRLPASLRLKASRDFARVRREGNSFPGRYLVLSVRLDPALPHFQFGLITTRKIGNAVTRNRTRRRLREVIRAEQTRIKAGCHIVTIARWRAPEATLEELRRDWLNIAKRAGILLSRSPGQPAQAMPQGGGTAPQP